MTHDMQVLKESLVLLTCSESNLYVGMTYQCSRLPEDVLTHTKLLHVAANRVDMYFLFVQRIHPVLDGVKMRTSYCDN